MFADSAKIFIKSGKGGDGHVSLSQQAARTAVTADAAEISYLKLTRDSIRLESSDIPANMLQKAERKAAKDFVTARMAPTLSLRFRKELL